jgi:hypothetical protein
MVWRLMFLAVIALHAATCPEPEEAVLGAVSGNCQNLKFPPLAAFGSLSLNPIERSESLSPLYVLAYTGLAANSKPHIDEAKQALTNLLINRRPGTFFFTADQAKCKIVGSSPVSSAFVLLAAAMVTEWDLTCGDGTLWVTLPVMGADKQIYQICDFVDFLWRDIHNPFYDDPDFPYDRYEAWEGEGAEDFNSYYAMFAFADTMLKTALNEEQVAKYEAVRHFGISQMKGRK